MADDSNILDPKNASDPVNKMSVMVAQAAIGEPTTGMADDKLRKAIDDHSGRGWKFWHKVTQEEALGRIVKEFQEKNHIEPANGNPSDEKTAKLLAAERQKTQQGKELDTFFANADQNQDMVTGVMLSSLGYKGDAVQQVSDFQKKHGRKPTGILSEEDAADLSKESVHSFSGQLTEGLAKSLPFGLGGVLAPYIQKFIEQNLVPDSLHAKANSSDLSQVKGLEQVKLPAMPVAHVDNQHLGQMAPAATGAGKGSQATGRGA